MDILLTSLVLMTTIGTTLGQGSTQLGVDCSGTPDSCNDFLMNALLAYCKVNKAACAGIEVEVNDLNECNFEHGADDGHDCNPAFAECVNTEGSFHCVCKGGYTDSFADDTAKSGVNCTDVDECKVGEGPCAPDHSTCTNNVGSFSCTCVPGYEGNATVLCSDVDECAQSQCPSGANCTNTRGSFTCTCPRGYLYNSTANTCDNINECDSNPCVTPATCKDTDGSFECTCPTDQTCTTNPCAGATDCSEGATCIEVNNGYTCECSSGFTGEPRGSKCVDIDECTQGLFSCHGRADCDNSNGSYNCVCQSGFSGDGRICEDVNECTGSNPPTCWANSTCRNTYGSAECACDEGFKLGANNISCEDINECDAVNCGDNGNCVNNQGSYACVCNTGYSGEPCSDINECDSNPCPANTQCRDSPGSYRCVCDFGYEGTGDNCTDIDECETEDCQNGGTCVNSPGTFECKCAPGYSGLPCENVNECASNPCSSNAGCSDIIGSFDCTCNEGFTGDGFNCSAFTCGNGTVVSGNACKAMTVLWGRITINGFFYTAKLQDTSSTEYQEMKVKVTDIFTVLFTAINITLTTADKMIFTAGSVIATTKLEIVPADEMVDANQILKNINDTIASGTAPLPQGVSLSAVALEDDNQGANSLVLQCPSTQAQACEEYTAALSSTVCEESASPICTLIPTDVDECTIGYGGQYGHDCNLTFSRCNNTDGSFVCECLSVFIDQDPANTGRNCSATPTPPTDGKYPGFE